MVIRGLKRSLGKYLAEDFAISTMQTIEDCRKSCHNRAVTIFLPSQNIFITSSINFGLKWSREKEND
jgi:hypothetical protein